ncbi:hypothetical protein BLD44_007110 [Mastigocladus laminosus UU774]|nr:hypothetical protein BLD44_007110 [Mastigocladus laminosus UU774]
MFNLTQLDKKSTYKIHGESGFWVYEGLVEGARGRKYKFSRSAYKNPKKRVNLTLSQQQIKAKISQV